MGQAVRPFLEYLVLQVAVAIVGLNLVKEKELGMSACLKAWIFGQMLLFAVLQVLAVPMILLRWKFDILFYSFIGIGILLFGIGCMRLRRTKIKIEIKKETWNWLSLVLLIAALLLILLQSGIYFFGMHLDEDDARWLAEANDALEYGDMITRDYDTGEYLGSFVMHEDVSSPWPLLFAILSRILINTRVSVIAHSIFPPIELIVMYGIYWLIGKEMFKKREAQLTFLVFTALITAFYGGSIYTQGRFALIRIWQGKATVAAIAIPIIMYLSICINKEDRSVDWIILTINATAACLMSGMGIIIGGIMIGVYGLYNIIAYQHWKRIPLWLCSLIPSVTYILINYYLRG